MFTCLQLEEIQRVLLEVPSLTNTFGERGFSYTADVLDWLVGLEEALESNARPEVGIVAAQRARLIAIERGIVEAYADQARKTSRRKNLESACVEVVESVTGIVLEAIAPDRNRIRLAEEMMQQVVTIARAKSLPGFVTHPEDPSSVDHWQIMKSDTDIMGGLVKIFGWVGEYDAQLLAERTISKNLGVG